MPEFIFDKLKLTQKPETFTVKGEKFDRQAFIFCFKNQFYSFYNECPHIGLPLDQNDNDFFNLEKTNLFCRHHGAEFLPKTGECVLGPCTGARLKKLQVTETQTQVMVHVSS